MDDLLSSLTEGFQDEIRNAFEEPPFTISLAIFVTGSALRRTNWREDSPAATLLVALLRCGGMTLLLARFVQWMLPKLAKQPSVRAMLLCYGVSTTLQQMGWDQKRGSAMMICSLSGWGATVLFFVVLLTLALPELAWNSLVLGSVPLMVTGIVLHGPQLIEDAIGDYQSAVWGTVLACAGTAWSFPDLAALAIPTLFGSAALLAMASGMRQAMFRWKKAL
mmetsp:Transcript_11703/g.26113  ORF Transcript_11703/g.26113 Transcript_11703/m.26113 type:complete len:221 (+) Transcript_11703:92-754(+)|eukprot:CAMPEP_0170572944 /NCGR_PEP_ID=MMETSP0224-20130122/2497_1 /TAXON_ID=285029 /ORGANISM="Togula jolla, Strain CCCM 725" /LENGTH=220 /DNA_ID=CAMNT_0010895489 /DNA_START=12 /DNA_END=677 /DNA_ORIENTATION=-